MTEEQIIVVVAIALVFMASFVLKWYWLDNGWRYGGSV